MRSLLLSLSLLLFSPAGEAAETIPCTRSIEMVIFAPYGDATLSKITLSDGTIWNAFGDFRGNYTTEDYARALKECKSVLVSPTTCLPSFFLLSITGMVIEVALAHESLECLPKLTDITLTLVPEGWLSSESLIALLRLSNGALFEFKTSTNPRAMEKFLSHWKIGDPILTTLDYRDLEHYKLINVSALVGTTGDFRDLHAGLGVVKLLSSPPLNSKN